MATISYLHNPEDIQKQPDIRSATNLAFLEAMGVVLAKGIELPDHELELVGDVLAETVELELHIAQNQAVPELKQAA